MIAAFEVRAECVILSGTGGDVMASVAGTLKARVVDMFERRADCVILAWISVVVIARVAGTYRDCVVAVFEERTECLIGVVVIAGDVLTV